MLAIGFLAGIAVSLVQIATSMQDTAFSTIPRLVAFLVGCCCCCRGCCTRPCHLHRRAVGESGALCPLADPLGRNAVCLPAGAGAGGWRARVRALARRRAAHRSRLARYLLWALRWRWRRAGRWWMVHGDGCPAGGMGGGGGGRGHRHRRSGGFRRSKPSGWRRRCWASRPVTPTPQTIDPNTQADSGICWSSRSLMGGCSSSRWAWTARCCACSPQSLERSRRGPIVFGPPAAQALIRLGAGLFSVGVRLALPVVALLVMVDMALALLGRLNQQLQLLSLAFPAKMLTGAAGAELGGAAVPAHAARVRRAGLDGRAADAGAMRTPWRTDPQEPSRRLSGAWKRPARKASFRPRGSWWARCSSWSFLGLRAPAGRAGSRGFRRTMRALFRRPSPEI